MMKILFTLLIALQGFIHAIGFAKAFGYGKIDPITRDISHPIGIIWLATGLLFLAVTLLFWLDRQQWALWGVVAAIASQFLIFTVWQDAKFGTIPNLIILIVAIFSLGMTDFENSFERDARQNLARTNRLPIEILTEADLEALPTPVQRYLKYANVLNKPKPNNARIVFEGEMRDKGKDYFPFTSEQYNFFDEPTRLFFMKGKMFGITVPGYHKYSDAKATMDIRLFGLFPIVQKSGQIMDKAETVTLFNDMGLMAPATLIDKRIQWQEIDSHTAKATFNHRGIAITATLYFNDRGQLINFRSDDRTAVADMNQYPFFTPVTDYQTLNGTNILSRGEAVWGYPDGDFTYGKFNLKEIEYNVNALDK